MDYEEFVKKIKSIKELGFIQTHRKGPTGIGKTLEDLLGIIENNIAGPDFSIYELKSGRKDAASMLTLFTKTPQPKGAIKDLLNTFGYQQRKRVVDQKQLTLTGEELSELKIPIMDKELHGTVDSIKPNSVGLKLELRNNKIIIGNDKGIDAYYDEEALKPAFEEKYHKLVYVLADSKIEKDVESFWYNEAYLLEGFSFEKFSKLVQEGKLKVDLRVGHYPNGRLHDHGTGFRIFPRHLPECFEKIDRIL
jgi:hypothetical protein